MSADLRGPVASGMRAAWRSMAHVVDGGAVHEVDGMLVALTNVPAQQLNTSLVEREPREPVAALVEVEALFARYGLGFGMDIDDGAHLAVESAARALGLAPLESRPAMAMAVADFTETPLPPGVEVRPVRDAIDLAAFVDVQIEAFGMRREIAIPFMPAAVIGYPDVEYYLGLLNGEPAAAAAGYYTNDPPAIGVFGVGTVPAARRRGLGTAVTERVIADAKDRAELTFLQSSADGDSVYERMGFRRVSDWVVWTRPT